jgi:hypothetical protein
MKTILTLVIVWILLTFLGVWFGNQIFDSSEIYPLVVRGESVWGTVKTKDKENHRTIGYVYSVDEREYSGTGQSGFGNPDFEEIRIGEDVIVIYDPQNPEKSYLGYPEYELAANGRAASFLAYIFSAVSFIFIAIAYFGVRSARSKN